jgi:hypothetical protein
MDSRLQALISAVAIVAGSGLLLISANELRKTLRFLRKCQAARGVVVEVLRGVSSEGRRDPAGAWPDDLYSLPYAVTLEFYDAAGVKRHGIVRIPFSYVRFGRGLALGSPTPCVGQAFDLLYYPDSPSLPRPSDVRLRTFSSLWMSGFLGGVAGLGLVIVGIAFYFCRSFGEP